MKSILLNSILIILCSNIYAQNTQLKLGIGANIMATAQFRYGIDILASKENFKWQALVGVNLIAATTNIYQTRTNPEYDADYMKKANDQLSGFGFNFQGRKLLYLKEYNPLSSKLMAFVSLNYNQQNHSVTFWQNEYVNKNGLYYYQLVKYKEALKSQSIQSQIILFQKGRKFFSELGFGIGYNFIKQTERLKLNRNYAKYFNDIGFKGIAPVISLRVGYFIFR